MNCRSSQSSMRRKSTTSVREDIAKLYNLHDYQKTCQLIDVPKFRHDPKAAPKGATDDEDGNTAFFQCECYKNLKKKTWFKPLLKAFFFLLHFSIVLVALGIAAKILADIEDPAPSSKLKKSLDYATHQTGNNSLYFPSSNLFWERLKEDFGVSIEDNKKKDFMLLVTDRVVSLKIEHNEHIRNEQRLDRSFIFWKWIYFTTVACATIGYGDVVPVTNNGRFFYMIFSIFGIPLMVSLLKACGSIIKALNKRFFRFLNSCIFKGDPLVSEHLMTIVSIILLFTGYVALGCVFNAALHERSLFESIYFWIVTFSTVGFGDVVQPLEDQIKWVFPLMIYRIFGLAMLAGVIDSVIDYLDYRKEELKKKKELLIRKSSQHFASFRFDSKKKLKERPARPPRPQLVNQRTIPPKRPLSCPVPNYRQENSEFSRFSKDIIKNSFNDENITDRYVHQAIFGDGRTEEGDDVIWDYDDVDDKSSTDN